MLVLSRKVGEKIQIGDGITVVVTRIAGNRVTLGVSAPRDLRIVRSELKIFSGPFVPKNKKDSSRPNSGDPSSQSA